jgi:PadR family transcriptional regulator PadR
MPGLTYFQISDHSEIMPRRRPGSLLPLEVSILAACRDVGSTGIHGFAIAHSIADAAESRRLTATGTLYRALHRLDEGGLIENWWEDPNDAAAAGRPLRRVYRITGAGATALARAESAASTPALRQANPGFAS